MTRVFIQLQGGFGNQLFQHSAGRAVAIRNNSELLLDTRFYDTNGSGRYTHDHFCIEARIAQISELPPPFFLHRGSATTFGENSAVIQGMFGNMNWK